MAILAAAAIPTVRGQLQTSEASAVVSELQNLRTALYTYKGDVGRYPDSLYYLSLSGTTLPTTDGCGVALTTAQQNAYRGPYINRTISTGATSKYVPVGGDTVMNAYGKDTVLAGQAAGPRDAIEIVLLGVDTTVAKLVDQAIDGAIGSANGLVEYVAGSNAGFDTLKYRIPIYPTHC